MRFSLFLSQNNKYLDIYKHKYNNDAIRTACPERVGMAKGASKPGKATKKVATVDKKAKKAAKKAK